MYRARRTLGHAARPDKTVTSSQDALTPALRRRTDSWRDARRTYLSEGQPCVAVRQTATRAVAADRAEDNPEATSWLLPVVGW